MTGTFRTLVGAALLLGAPATASAGLADEVGETQGFIMSIIGLGPVFSSSFGANLGVGAQLPRTQLFADIDPALDVGLVPPAMAYSTGILGTGLGMYTAHGSFSFGGRQQSVGDLTTQHPGMFWLSYFSGANPIAFFEDDPPFGIGPGVAMHAGGQGPLYVHRDKVGALAVGEGVHGHMGFGVATYIQAEENFCLMLSGSWMPETLALLTWGQVAADGRYNPAYDDIPDELIESPELPTWRDLLEADNDIAVLRDTFFEARLYVWKVGVYYQYRPVWLAAKQGRDLQEGSAFVIGTHLLTIGIGSFAER